MTYAHQNPSPQTRTKTHTPSAVSRASGDHEDPAAEDLLGPRGAARQYEKLFRRFDSLEAEDPSDQYCRLSSALNATRKSYFETTALKSEQAALTEVLNAPGAMSEDERNRKIEEICKMASRIKPKDYDRKKLKARAKRQAGRAAKKGEGYDPIPLT